MQTYVTEDALLDIKPVPIYTKMLSLCCVLSLSMIVNGSTLISQKVQYNDMDKAPDISSWIRPLSVVSILQTCLIRCSVTPECKAVLYENSKCYLYSTSDGSSVLIFGQQAVSVVSRKSIYGTVFLIYVKVWYICLCVPVCLRACDICVWAYFSAVLG